MLLILRRCWSAISGRDLILGSGPPTLPSICATTNSGRLLDGLTTFTATATRSVRARAWTLTLARRDHPLGSCCFFIPSPCLRRGINGEESQILVSFTVWRRETKETKASARP